ncbi:hypothetical protein ES706_04779 [subsurface metagenome]
MAIATVEKGISEIVGVFTDPIVVTPGAAAYPSDIPQWLREAITLERLVENMRALKEGTMTATDAEACIYLSTVSLEVPLDHDWTQIFMYVFTKVYERHRTKDPKVTVPDDIRVVSLNNQQMQDLKRLKDWIYEKRTGARLDKDRAERREKREAEAERKKKEQLTFQL